MHRYKNREVTKVVQELEEVICNQCGKVIKSKNGMHQEEVCSVHKAWGYFSDKDMEVHDFDLCESCYDRLIAGFKVPVEIRE